jgi:hypothetical protein
MQHGPTKEKRMERRQIGSLIDRRRPWRTWKCGLDWMLQWMYELTTCYGERPSRTVFCSIVTVLLFTLIFAFVVHIGEVAPGTGGDPARVEGWRNLLNALTHSVSTFATIGFNTLEPLGTGARLLTALGICLGYRILRALHLHVGESNSPLLTPIQGPAISVEDVVGPGTRRLRGRSIHIGPVPGL